MGRMTIFNAETNVYFFFQETYIFIANLANYVEGGQCDNFPPTVIDDIVPSFIRPSTRTKNIIK